MRERIAHSLDWREQRRGFEPFLDHQGGVVHVHASKDSAGSVFAKVLREIWLPDECWPRPWHSVQLNPDDPYTHYIGEFVRLVFRSLNAKPPRPRQKPITVNVGTDNEVGNDFSMSGNEINVGVDEYARSLEDDERVDSLCDLLRKRLKKIRVAIVVLDTHRYKEDRLTVMGRRLWQGGLADLTDAGLLVVDIYDPEQMPANAAWPPGADAIVPLPDRFDGDARVSALDDLTRIARDEGAYQSEEAARVFAETILDASDHDVSLAYANLARALMSKGVGNGIRV